jgi:hypothetical protein
MDIPLDFNYDGTQTRSPPKDTHVSFLVSFTHPIWFGLDCNQNLYPSSPSYKVGRPLACFWYLCIDNRDLVPHFWNNNYQKGLYTQGGLECKGWGPTFEEWIASSSNASSTRCFDNPSIGIGQVQLCAYANLIGQIFGQKEEYCTILSTLQDQLTIVHANLNLL